MNDEHIVKLANKLLREDVNPYDVYEAIGEKYLSPLIILPLYIALNNFIVKGLSVRACSGAQYPNWLSPVPAPQIWNDVTCTNLWDFIHTLSRAPRNWRLRIIDKGTK